MKTINKKNLIRLIKQIAVTTIFILLALGISAIGQTVSKEKVCEDKNKKSKKQQKSNVKKVAEPFNVLDRARIAPGRTDRNQNSNRNRIRTSFQSNYFAEKSIVVHPKAYISLCLLRGSIKVNGWNRNEARIFVKGKKNNQIGYKVREVERIDKKPVWLQFLGYNPNENVETNYNTCLSGEIELDIPQNATIKIENKHGESQTSIDSVKIAYVEVLGGDIYLNNISDRINAQTYQGGVTVRNSSGKMVLSTTTGNIIALNTYSTEVGDYLKAKTRSGAITLQSVEQKEVESSSISGSINYVGRIKTYGKYGFSTTNGSINLAIPSDSSCQVIAAYGGSFQSELPLKDIFKERTESLVFLKGRMGKGEANLNLKSFNGTISIREKKESVLANF